MLEIAFALCVTNTPLNFDPKHTAPMVRCSADLARYDSYPACLRGGEVALSQARKSGFGLAHFYCLGIPNEEVSP